MEDKPDRRMIGKVGCGLFGVGTGRILDAAAIEERVLGHPAPHLLDFISRPLLISLMRSTHKTIVLDE